MDDIPEQAIGIWLEADIIHVRFPDRQRVAIPLGEWPRLVSILRAREHYTATKRRMTVATEAAPTQWEIDRWVKVKEQMDREEADRILADIGL